MFFAVLLFPFGLFSQELAQITQQTLSVHDYVPISQVNHFACIQFIAFHLGLDQEASSLAPHLGEPIKEYVLHGVGICIN